MAVTTEKSTQVTQMEATPPTKLDATELVGKLRIARFDFTQGSAAGDATSTMDLVKIPPGKTVRIFKSMSRIIVSAFGAARLLDIGHTGYTNLDGTAVAAAADVFMDGQDVSAAALIRCGLGTNAFTAEDAFAINAKEAVVIQAVVAGGTIPAAATINGYLVYVED